MSQDAVFDFLRLQFQYGNKRYWRKYEIHRELIRRELVSHKCSKGQIGRMVNKLYAHGFLDIEIDPVNMFKQSYRIKEKYICVVAPQEVSVWFQ